MDKVLVAAFAAATLAASAPAAQAGYSGPDPGGYAVVPTVTTAGPAGATCGLAAPPDATPGGGGWYDGAVTGGPLALVTFGSPTSVYYGNVTCTVQVNAPAHSGANAAPPVAGPVTLGVATAAGTVSFFALPTDQVYLCTQVSLVNGPTLYWHATGGFWSTGSGSECDLAISGWADLATQTQPVDPVICPILAVFLPPDGDVPPVWDCPPYS